MDLNDRLKIEEMEEKYDSFKPRINALVEAIDDFQKHYEDYVKFMVAKTGLDYQNKQKIISNAVY